MTPQQAAGAAMLQAALLIPLRPNMTTESETLHCSTLGETHAACICEHLADNAAQRWNCDYPSQDNPKQIAVPS
jgi:hypothetical protein